MAALTLRGIRKSFGAVEVLRGIDLDIADGEFAVFVGPSGCGKSTLLRMIAGLEDIERGEVAIGGECINAVPPAERGIAMVFQSYALYPHMTVAQNMGFALKMAGQSKAEVDAAVDRAAEILQIGPLLARKPRELSGGQRQRVAIGRAIVRKPKVFLFDEPLSNLDAALRVQMRIELSRLHKELGATMVYVTHDQVEAMTLGDRIAVFNAGRVEQVGAPLELYTRPVNQFVAGFLGSPRMNFIRGQALAAGAGRMKFEAAGAGLIELPLPAGGRPAGADEMVLGVRPEHLGVARADEGLAARIEVLEHLGDALIVHASLRGSRESVSLRLAADHPGLAAGQDIGLVPLAAHTLMFDGSGRALSPH
ncbi:MAG TPA: sn-glycerol-3-phosphate ABC transporter ATP-binding protein UgpC [Piscinibacter sp.]|nr:sn-glycerol-3-phosphate ABC transporter ATP-binding protein UgpC [Piscinibacter sp.]